MADVKLSPKSQSYEIIFPEETVDRSVNATEFPKQLLLKEKSTDGNGLTVTLCVMDDEHPVELVAISVAV